MTSKMRLIWMVVLGVGFLAAEVSAEETPDFKTRKEKMSYAFGVDLGRNLKRQGIEMEVEALLKGLRGGFSGEKLLMSDDDLVKNLSAFHSDLKRRQNEMKRKQAEMNQKQIQTTKVAEEESKKAGDAFLAENKTKVGVVTLPSGLQYKILRAGEGKKPTETDTVECHYVGSLINGNEFDSSYRRGQPVTFKITSIIPGWREALKLMPVGSKWQLFIPPGLAYGARGSGRIPPNSTLVFEVELLAVK
jgi:FKBP-type peptidyl-prolyl cis-trans isomerase FklB